MAGSYNKCTFIGNLTRDPEIRYVQSGDGVTQFGIAVNRRTKSGDQVPTFINIVAWDNGNYKLAEICNTYLRKGMTVLVEGRLANRSYDDRDGNKRQTTEIVIDTMQMLDPKKASDGNGDGAHLDELQPAGVGSAGGDPDQEIPFDRG